jgi:hypothetical protein
LKRNAGVVLTVVSAVDLMTCGDMERALVSVVIISVTVSVIVSAIGEAGDSERVIDRDIVRVIV